MIRSILLFISILCVVNAFLASSGRPLTVASRNAADHTQLKPSVLLTMVKDKSRSGTKRDRLDKLAELEDSRVETDKGFVGLAAGGFVGFLLLLLVLAFATGVLDPVY